MDLVQQTSTGNINMLPSHQRWQAKVEAQSECVRVAHTFLHIWAPIRMLGRCLVTKFSASELSRKFIKGALLGWVCIFFITLLEVNFQMLTSDVTYYRRPPVRTIMLSLLSDSLLTLADALKKNVRRLALLPSAYEPVLEKRQLLLMQMG